MKNKVLFKIFLASVLSVFLFGSCDRNPKLGHLLRVIVYYPCPGYSSNMMYPYAPQKQDYGIYQVLVKIADDNLTDELLEKMNSRVKACGIQNFFAKMSSKCSVLISRTGVSFYLSYSLIHEIFIEQTPTGIESFHDIMNIDNNIVL